MFMLLTVCVFVGQVWSLLASPVFSLGQVCALKAGATFDIRMKLETYMQVSSFRLCFRVDLTGVCRTASACLQPGSPGIRICPV